jgi:hypothetical protein
MQPFHAHQNEPPSKPGGIIQNFPLNRSRSNLPTQLNSLQGDHGAEDTCGNSGESTNATSCADMDSDGARARARLDGLDAESSASNDLAIDSRGHRRRDRLIGCAGAARPGAGP